MGVCRIGHGERITAMTRTTEWLFPEEADRVAGEEDEEEVEDAEHAGDQDDEPDAPFDPRLFSDAQ